MRNKIWAGFIALAIIIAACIPAQTIAAQESSPQITELPGETQADNFSYEELADGTAEVTAYLTDEPEISQTVTIVVRTGKNTVAVKKRIKKNARAGTYMVKVKATAAAKGIYKKTSRTYTIKVTVKNGKKKTN